MSGEVTEVDVAILGAGVSGLCLARALADGPLRDLTVLLVDGARDDDELRTLSYWARGETALDDLEVRRWTLLRVHDGARSVEVPLREHSYRTVFFDELQREVRRRFEGDPRLRVVDGRAADLADGEDAAAFTVGAERVRARWVFDSRFARRELAVDRARWHLLWQHFHGWIVRASRDVFDPSAAGFLDFRTGLSRGDTFFYVLPFSAREALVELVSFEPVDAEAAAARWLREHAGLAPGEYAFARREAGVSPMTEQPFARVAGRRVRRIGVAGGRLKPSTGYALTRILGDCDAIVRSLAAHGHPFEAPPDRALYRLLDGVLLELWGARPAAMPAVFAAMFARGRGDRVLRFLDERASAWDLVALVSTLPVAPFAWAAARWLWRRLRGPRSVTPSAAAPPAPRGTASTPGPPPP